MARTIEFTIKDGDVSMDLKGFNGVGCKEIADNLGRGLGAQTHEVLKPEIHNSCETTTHNTARA